MKRKMWWVSLAVALLVGVLPAVSAYAISDPDDAPTVQDIFVYRNILETGDWFMMVDENTPYAAVPTDYSYPEAFVWRLIDTDGSTEIAQALGYTFHDDGYGYNLIAFYLSAAEFTAASLSWGDLLHIRLSETPAAFPSPDSWNFDVQAGDYSSLTDTNDVKAAIAAQILTLAGQFDVRWGFSGATSLLDESEVGTRLSLYGQAFFRGAIFGVQSLAPAAFPLVVENINTDLRTWSSNYSSSLAAQMAGTSLENAFTAGQGLTGVNYNLFPLLIILGIILSLVVFNWMIAGGNLWRGLIDAGAPLVIGARLTMVGLGEVGLVAAVCWLYISAKMWRMI